MVASARIDPRLSRVFQTEILHQWEFVQIADDVIRRALSEGQVASAWFGLDALLGALARISRIFFPTRSSGPCARYRCKALRAEFEVSERSPLSSQAVRNASEHFHEKIDAWFVQSTAINFADRNIGQKSSIVGLDLGDYAKWFDPDAMHLWVFGEDLDLRALIKEAGLIVGRVRQRSQG